MIKNPNKDNTRDLYFILYYMDLIGGAFVNFALAVTFSVGLRWGGIWVGLPLFCAAFMWLAVTAIVFLVKIKEEGVQALPVPGEASDHLRTNAGNEVPVSSTSL
jgi:hypothetical protein